MFTLVLFSKDNLTTTFEIEFTDDCREEAAIFKIHSSGVAEHGNSNKCLAVKEKDTDIVALELIDNCNGSEAELKVYDFPPQGTAEILLRLAAFTFHYIVTFKRN